VLPSVDNSTKLLRVISDRREPLLFLGHPLDLHYSVVLSNHIPRYTILHLDLPYIIETFCKYIVSLSGALALLNVVPCYALDGQWILTAFVELLLYRIIPDEETRGLLYTVIVLFGTLLLALNIVIAMWTLLR